MKQTAACHITHILRWMKFEAGVLTDLEITYLRGFM